MHFFSYSTKGKWNTRKEQKIFFWYEEKTTENETKPEFKRKKTAPVRWKGVYWINSYLIDRKFLLGFLSDPVVCPKPNDRWFSFNILWSFWTIKLKFYKKEKWSECIWKANIVCVVCFEIYCCSSTLKWNDVRVYYIYLANKLTPIILLKFMIWRFDFESFMIVYLFNFVNFRFFKFTIKCSGILAFWVSRIQLNEEFESFIGEMSFGLCKWV